ncbi:acylphosphatase [Candidatus Babeliales bacterium]|nr:acylphosphatase [Candidatus Babeliales bacterium]MCF7899153.1 acylphosphatase [Candidatus Babeliales bacterium]
MRKCLKIKVIGKVQGVGYRSFLQKHATKLGVEGTIQNQSDSSVLILACGISDKLDDFLDFVYEGSKQTKIENVAVTPMVPERDFRGVFRVIGVNES